MVSSFDAKIFNPEVFGTYTKRVPRTKLNQLLNSGVLRRRGDLKVLLSEQVGGNYITHPIKGLIGGAPLNYDGATDITATSADTYYQSMVVTGRAKGWVEKDFSFDMTQENWMGNVAEQVMSYWEDIDQDTLLSILKGIYAMTGAGNEDFVSEHTYDITDETDLELAKFNVTTLNSSIQKSSGDHKKKFSLAVMHSQIATNLENLNLIQYLKYTDANGVERDLGLATLNGKLVIIDDGMPTASVSAVSEVLGTYTAQITTALVVGDTINIAGKTLLAVTSGAIVGSSFVPGVDADANVTAILAALVGFMPVGYNISGATDTLTLQQMPGFGSSTAPTVITTGTGVVGAIGTTAAGVNGFAAYTSYTTYVLGDGAIDFEDVGVKVPFEMDRAPATNGGQDTLYTRQRHLYAPHGISFTKSSMATDSPTDAELENGANWGLVKNNDGSAYFPHKVIPIARVISKG